MANHIHFDCFNGISGDMTLGALVDLGVPLESLQEGLAGLPIGKFGLRAEKIKRSGIVGTKVHVDVVEETSHGAHLRHIEEKVRAANLSEWVTERAVAAYHALAEAEAVVHGSTKEKIHFHEVGANDAIVDIAGSMLGFELLGAQSFTASPVVLGSGSVKCAHGTMPVPAPATAEILRGVPTRDTPIDGELTTPTGAAILKTLVTNYVSPQGFATTQIGYGAGGRELEGHPNYLRLALGQVEAPLAALGVATDTIVSIETEVDDMSPELTGYLMEKLLAEGARDVQFFAVQMKKNRPAQSIRVLCDTENQEKIAAIVFRETSTFGLRIAPSERYCLRRSWDSVATAAGEIKVKIGYLGEEVLKVTAEYESCKQAASEAGIALREVFNMANEAIQQKFFRAGADRSLERERE